MRTLKIPTKTSFFRSLVQTQTVLILVFSTIVLGMIFLNTRRTIRRLASEVIAASSETVERKVRGFVGPVRTNLRLTAGLVTRAPRLTLSATSVTVIGIPTLDALTRVRSLFFADERGGFLELTRAPAAENDASWMLLTYSPMVNARTAQVSRLDVAGQTRSVETIPFLEDPREEIWFRSAIDALGNVSFPDTSRLFRSRPPSIVTSIAVKAQDDTVWVIGFDLSTEEVATFRDELRPTPNSAAFLAAGVDPFDTDGPSLRAQQRRAQLENPDVRTGLEQWVNRGRAQDDLFEYRSQSGRWWASIRVVEYLEQQPLIVGVFVPEPDLLDEIQTTRIVVLTATIATLLAALLVAISLARGYSRPLAQLVANNTAIRRLELDNPMVFSSPIREIDDLNQAQDETRRALQSFARYVPLDLVRQLMAKGIPAEVGGETKHLAILFTDIRGFTSIAESMSPDDLTHHMSEYFQFMCRSLHERRGTIDKFIGDAILAFWGAPEEIERPATCAVQAVLDCCSALRQHEEIWRRAAKPNLYTRFGLAFGPVVVGNTGFRDRLSYTVLGDTANLASRLESLNSRYGTQALVSESVRETLRAEGTESDFLFRTVDRVAVKGKDEEIDIHQLVGLADADNPGARELFLRYEDALRLYFARQFTKARGQFERLAPRDVASSLLAERCFRYEQDPPDGGWNGAERLEAK